MVAVALEAAELLTEKGISAQVLNVSTIKPLNSEQVAKAAGETGAVVTCEEHNIIGGLGSAVAEALGNIARFRLSGWESKMYLVSPVSQGNYWCITG